MLKEKFFSEHAVPRVIIASLLLAALLPIAPVRANDKNLALLKAAEEGRWELVPRLLKEGAGANVRRHGDEATPLMLAAAKGRHDIVETLLEHGADVNAANINGWTALMAASANGDHPRPP